MTPQFILRRMRRADLEQVHTLEIEIFPTPWSLNSYEFELERNPASEQWVIQADTDGNSQIAAYSVCWRLGDELHIANLAVAEDFRKQGLGRRLLAHILDHAAGEGMHSSTLEVRAGNVAARTLYESFGFREVARRKGYYRDNHEDALLMQLPHLQVHPPVNEKVEVVEER